VYIRVLSDEFLLKAIVFTVCEHEYMNIHPPPIIASRNGPESKFKESSLKVRTQLVNFHPSKSPDVIFGSSRESSPDSSPSSSPGSSSGSNPGLINR
jgi:hypothetical protein